MLINVNGVSFGSLLVYLVAFIARGGHMSEYFTGGAVAMLVVWIITIFNGYFEDEEYDD